MHSVPPRETLSPARTPTSSAPAHTTGALVLTKVRAGLGARAQVSHAEARREGDAAEVRSCGALKVIRVIPAPGGAAAHFLCRRRRRSGALRPRAAIGCRAISSISSLSSRFTNSLFARSRSPPPSWLVLMSRLHYENLAKIYHFIWLFTQNLFRGKTQQSRHRVETSSTRTSHHIDDHCQFWYCIRILRVWHKTLF